MSCLAEKESDLKTRDETETEAVFTYKTYLPPLLFKLTNTHICPRQKETLSSSGYRDGGDSGCL
jgi:hypothetical protein